MIEFVIGDRVRYLPCMHTYHTDCIDDWLMRMAERPPEMWVPGIFAILLMMEAIRKAAGGIIAGLVWTMLVYGFLGNHLPGVFEAEVFRPTKTVVYLYASVDQQLERTRKGRERPLLKSGDPRETLEALMTVRDPLYRKIADIVVETDSREVRAVAKEIEEKLAHLEGGGS